MIILASRFSEGFLIIWHIGEYVIGGLLAVMLIWLILSIFFDF